MRYFFKSITVLLCISILFLNIPNDALALRAMTYKNSQCGEDKAGLKSSSNGEYNDEKYSPINYYTKIIPGSLLSAPKKYLKKYGIEYRDIAGYVEFEDYNVIVVDSYFHIINKRTGKETVRVLKNLKAIDVDGRKFVFEEDGNVGFITLNGLLDHSSCIFTKVSMPKNVFSDSFKNKSVIFDEKGQYFARLDTFFRRKESYQARVQLCNISNLTKPIAETIFGREIVENAGAPFKFLESSDNIVKLGFFTNDYSFFEKPIEFYFLDNGLVVLNKINGELKIIKNRMLLPDKVFTNFFVKNIEIIKNSRGEFILVKKEDKTAYIFSLEKFKNLEEDVSSTNEGYMVSPNKDFVLFKSSSNKSDSSNNKVFKIVPVLVKKGKFFNNYGQEAGFSENGDYFWYKYEWNYKIYFEVKDLRKDGYPVVFDTDNLKSILSYDYSLKDFKFSMDGRVLLLCLNFSSDKDLLIGYDLVNKKLTLKLTVLKDSWEIVDNTDDNFIVNVLSGKNIGKYNILIGSRIDDKDENSTENSATNKSSSSGAIIQGSADLKKVPDFAKQHTKEYGNIIGYVQTNAGNYAFVTERNDGLRVIWRYNVSGQWWDYKSCKTPFFFDQKASRFVYSDENEIPRVLLLDNIDYNPEKLLSQEECNGSYRVFFNNNTNSFIICCKGANAKYFVAMKMYIFTDNGMLSMGPIYSEHNNFPKQIDIKKANITKYFAVLSFDNISKDFSPNSDESFIFEYIDNGIFLSHNLDEGLLKITSGDRYQQWINVIEYYIENGKYLIIKRYNGELCGFDIISWKELRSINDDLQTAISGNIISNDQIAESLSGSARPLKSGSSNRQSFSKKAEYKILRDNKLSGLLEQKNVAVNIISISA